MVGVSFFFFSFFDQVEAAETTFFRMGGAGTLIGGGELLSNGK